MRREDEKGVNNSHHCSPSLPAVDPIRFARTRFGLDPLRQRLLVNTLSEFFITFVLIFVGTAISIQQYLLGGENSNNNLLLQLTLGWSALVTMCVYVVLYTSGCHMNPIITVVFAHLGWTPWRWVPAYVFAEFLGALLGNLCAYSVHRESLLNFTGGEWTIHGQKATAGLFSTFPKEHISNSTAFFESFSASAFFMVMVIALNDRRNQVPLSVFPMLIGISLFVTVSAFSMNAGGVLNPVANLAGRVFCLWMGYGWTAFSWHEYHFWVPLVAPFVGAVFGTWTYTLFVGIHIPDVVAVDVAKEGNSDDENISSSAASSSFNQCAE